MGRHIYSFLFNGFATLKKFSARVENTLQGPKEDLSSVRLLKFFTTQTVAVVSLDSFSRPGRIR